MSDRPEDDRSWYTQVMDDQLQALRLQREEALALRDRRSGSLRDRQNATRAPPDHYPIPGRTASRRTAPREERPSSGPEEEESPAEQATSAGGSLLNPLTLGALAVGGLIGGAVWLGSNLWSATEPQAEAARAPEQLRQERGPGASSTEAGLHQAREQAAIAEEEEERRRRRMEMQLEADMMLARRLQRQEEEQLRQSVRVPPESRRYGGRSGDVEGPAASHGDRQLNRGAGTQRQRPQQQREDASRPSDASRASRQRSAGYHLSPEDPMAQFLQALASSTGRGHSQQLRMDSAAPVLDDAGIEIREIVGPGGRSQIMLQMRQPTGGALQGNGGGGGGGLQELLGAVSRLSQLEAAVGEVPRGISPDAIACLPTRTYHRRPRQGQQSNDGAIAEHDQCSICLSEYEEGENVRTLPCLHCYHVSCIDNWLQRSKSCPVCKHDVDVSQ